jgi:hypothetical protein
MKEKETIEEAAERLIINPTLEDKQVFKEGAKWQSERSQMIVPPDATNIEVFAIKPDENGKLFAYIGYKISNGNFEFSVVPFTESNPERMYSEEEVIRIIQECKSYLSLVEWLLDRIEDVDLTTEMFERIKQQAKEMEKEQRKKDFVNGYKARAKASKLIFDETSEMYAIKLFEKTFKSE